MKAWIVFYDMKRTEPKTRTKILEELFGKSKQSNYGQYHYNIKGKIPPGEFIRPVRAAVILKKKYVKDVSTFLNSYKIKHRICEIKVQKEDFKKKKFL